MNITDYSTPEASLRDWDELYDDPMECQYACSGCAMYGCADRCEEYAEGQDGRW